MHALTFETKAINDSLGECRLIHLDSAPTPMLTTWTFQVRLN